MSGKTTLARKMAAQAASNNRNVLVLDPLKDSRWLDAGASFLTDNPDEFISLAKQNTNCTLIIDEAGEFCGRYDKESFWLATRSRHRGHQSIFCSQRPNLISPNIRSNCSKIFCFCVNYKDAKSFAEDFCCDELENASNLKQGECIYYSRYGEAKRYNVFS
ncbi:MAG: ATP-binding protein [Saprospiraceae bacterium]|nr:ATP-binding protein [Saprospiraceae bacterium]